MAPSGRSVGCKPTPFINLAFAVPLVAERVNIHYLQLQDSFQQLVTREANTVWNPIRLDSSLAAESRFRFGLAEISRTNPSCGAQVQLERVQNVDLHPT